MFEFEAMERETGKTVKRERTDGAVSQCRRQAGPWHCFAVAKL